MDKTKIIDLKFIFKTINTINITKDFQSVAGIIFNFIEELVKFNMAVIYRVNEGGLEIVSCRGSDIKKMKQRVPFRIGEGAVGWVAKEKKALLINDVLESQDIKVRQFMEEDPIIRSFLAVPLVVGNKLIGILSVSSSSPNEYNDHDVEAISIIASQGAALLELNNAITETKRFSNHILENINSGVIVIDEDCKTIVFNKAAETISGYKSNEVIGKNILELELKEDNKDWYIVESLHSGKIFFEHPGYLICKDGSYVNIRFSTSILKNEDGSINGCICIFRDNTEIEKLHQQMARADKLAAIGRLTSGITHEIRNPLLPIRTASRFLLEKFEQKEEHMEAVRLLKIINEESERLNRFLDQFINLNKQDMDIRGESFIKEIIEETAILVKHSLINSNIKLFNNLPKDEVRLPYNKDVLKQIFINLFLNSIDAIISKGSDEGEIYINVETKDSKCKIRFRDTGCGIKQETINNIFDPFYTTKDNGTGLGLSIVHNLVSSLGGQIYVESQVEEGTEFTIELSQFKKAKGG